VCVTCINELLENEYHRFIACAAADDDDGDREESVLLKNDNN
jgi:hypothetical protein